MKDLISQYYRLIVHNEAQKFGVSYIDKTGEVKYPEQKDKYLTETDIEAMLRGDRTISVHLVQSNNAKCGCIDLDSDNSEDLTEVYQLAIRLKESASNLGINAYIEYSGRKGFHLWVFSEQSIFAKTITDCLEVIAKNIGYKPKEIYPKGKDVNVKLFGSIHLGTKKRCGFIDDTFDHLNPQINPEAQLGIMQGIKQNSINQILEVSSKSNTKEDYSSRSPEEIKNKLDLLEDHPSCIKFLLDKGLPDYLSWNNGANTITRYCVSKGYSLEDTLKLATQISNKTSFDNRGKKTLSARLKDIKDHYKPDKTFDCGHVWNGLSGKPKSLIGCIEKKCKVHFNHNPNKENEADTNNQKVSDSLDFVRVNSLIFASMINLSSEGKECVKSQILRQSEKIVQNYLSQISPNISDSSKLLESEVLAYLLQNPESIIDYSDIYPQGFKVTIKKFESISDYLDYLYSLKVPSSETIEEYLDIIRDKGLKIIASEKVSSYPNLILKSDNVSDTLSKIIDDSEKLLSHSVSDINLLPTSEKIEGLITQLLAEDRTAIPTFSEDLNYMLNGGFSRGRFYVISAGPANGKSTLCLQIADHASLNGYKVGYFSFEMSLDQIFTTQLSRLGEINSGYLEAKTYLKNNSLKLKMLDAIKDYYEDYSDNIHIVECDDSFTPNKILSVIKKLKLDLVFIDYLQLMNSGDKDIDNNGNETTKISKIATELKRLARKSDTPIIAISDINKTSFDSAKSGKKTLDMTALRDSFKIAHSADCVMLLSSYDFEPKNENDTIKTQLDFVKSLWEKKDLMVAKMIENIDNRTTLDKSKADTFSRLYIDKNRTGKIGDILFKYSKAIHKFESLDYLTKINKEEF